MLFLFGVGKIWEKSFAIWIALRPKRVLTCKRRNEHDACPKAHPTRNHDGGVVMRKKLADHVPSMSLDDQMAKAAIDLLSVFKWFETDGLISQRRDWLIGFKV